MREQVYDTLTTIDNDIIVYDPTSVIWTEFDYPNGYNSHTVTIHEVLKPYLISFLYYGTVIYEDILLLLNGIDDIFELRPGVKIKIPQIEDLKTFLNKQKNRVT